MIRFSVMGALAALVILSAPVFAADATRSVPARLTFAPTTTLDLQVRTIASEAATDTLTFGYTGSEPYALSAQYVRIAYASTYANWKVVTYTANRSTRDALHNNWGALIGTDTTNKVALMWKAFADTQPGGAAWNGTPSDTWMYFKDTGDSDYVEASGGGYTTVLYGSGLGSASVYYGAPDVSPAAFYVGAVTAGLNPDRYETAIRFDLLHL